MGLMVDLSPSIGPALVVGGGAVAARKVRGLLDAGFSIVVVAPAIGAELRAMEDVTCRERGFEEADLDGIGIAFACTDSRDVNRTVGEAARERGIPVNVADRQEESTFSSTALHRNGDLLVAVATSGGSPGLAAKVRDRIAEGLGSGWAETVAEARAERETRVQRAREAE